MEGMDLVQFNREFSKLLVTKPEWPELYEKGREMLSELVINPDWFKPVLTGLVLDEEFLKSQWQSIDPNDIQIYRHPEKLFTVRAFIWEPNVMYPIHDHGSWGIVGAHINQIRERKFARIDNGQVLGHAEIKEIADNTLSPGGVTYVLPMNEGIHQMQALDGQTSVTIHVYGTPVRKGFIHYFNPHNQSLRRVYPPSIDKKVMAIRTLGSITQSWSEATLNQAAAADVPDYIRQECKIALNKINS